MVNSIGLANPGARPLLRRAPAAAGRARRAAGRQRRRLVARRVRRRRRAGSRADRRRARIELNVSCPNVETGCISIGTDARRDARAGRALPGRDRPAAAGRSCRPASPTSARSRGGRRGRGATGWRSINTVRGMAHRPGHAAAAAGRRRGRAVRPGDQAGRRCTPSTAAAQRTGLPIVGMGGVASPRTCIEYLAAGATVVGVGTALFRDPGCRPDPGRAAGRAGPRGLTDVAELRSGP